MKILGIETSCDETAVCIIEAEGTFAEHFSFKILGNALYSQVAIHAPYGGVFPNLAKREHARNLVPLMTQALKQSGQCTENSLQEESNTTVDCQLSTTNLKDILEREPELLEQLEVFLDSYARPDIDCVAVTAGPGLEPALWVGVNFARVLSMVWGIPLVAVNHMEGHVVMSMIDSNQFTENSLQKESNSTVDCRLSTVNFPLLSLLISGGHTELVLSREWMQYERIGETRDDAVGEAFDKVARLLGLPYPGGPEVSRLALKARSSKLEATFHFTPPMLHSDDFDFSFSGIKTEVRRYIELHPIQSEDDKMNIARAFEDAVTEVLVKKTLQAVEEYDVQTVVVGGGVSANTYIREQLDSFCKLSTINCKLLFPPAELATDNAIMIALAGYFRATKNEFSDPATLQADGNWRLASDMYSVLKSRNGSAQ
jgi:N6-L-threonylcarbamoyladenine synthase